MLSSLPISGLTIDWSRIPENSYLRNIEALHGLEHLEFHHPVTFFTGENGSGKSTLLEAIAIAYGFNPEGGTKNYNFSTFDSHSELHRAVRLSRGPVRNRWGYYLRAESFYNVATKENEYTETEQEKAKHLHRKSHGESFLETAQDNFQPHSLNLIDEPEAALSPQRQLTMFIEIYRCASAGAQFIIATHSPILTAIPGAEILSFDNGRIHPCTYEETGSYQITSIFINNREKMIREMLADRDDPTETGRIRNKPDKSALP